MNKTHQILCVHQGWELYGSDRVFIQSVKAFRKNYPYSKIIVHLPQEGEIIPELQAYADQIITNNLSVIRKNKFKPKSILYLIRNMVYNYKLARCSNIVYINTGVILSYNLLSFFKSGKYLMHIHEIPESFVKLYFYLLMKLTKAKVITNSNATAESIQKGYVIHNAIKDFYTLEDNSNQRTFNLLLIGRINGWKGHQLAVEALSILFENNIKDIKLTFVGSHFSDQKQYLHSLKQKIDALKLNHAVDFIDFHPDPKQYYQQSNIVIVPSTKPEPFGLVAIEAMCAANPVIAANHGGLTEIVTKDTGILFTPNSAQSLAEAIQYYYLNRSIMNEHGQNGRKRFLELFQEEHYLDNFIKAVAH